MKIELRDDARALTPCKTNMDKACIIDEMTNKFGQRIKFYEHPILGGDCDVIAMCGDVVVHTTFFDMDDLMSSYDDYHVVIVGDKAYMMMDVL